MLHQASSLLRYATNTDSAFLPTNSIDIVSKRVKTGNMDHNYWNVDAFIADSQKLPCIFNIDVPNMGQIQSTEERDIKALSRIELPFWLAELMALK